MISQRFAGKRAVITGGASGIGQGVAARLAGEGARVAIWDMNQAAIDATCAAIQGEVDGVRSISPMRVLSRQLVPRRSRDWAASTFWLRAPASPAPTRRYGNIRSTPGGKSSMSISTACFIATVKSSPVMLSGGYGRIVNVASIAGKEGNPNASAYSASKAGVIGLTKSLGKELATSNITVNCVTPAAVKTAIFDQISQSHIDFMLSKIPMGRFGAIDEVVALISWLASEECSFSTGAVFDVSGGRATY